MSDSASAQLIDIPISLLCPVKITNEAREESCGLFFPNRTKLMMGLVVAWEGESHLIHLDGPHAFKEAAVGVGNPIDGIVINAIEYRVDVSSRYKSGNIFDPAGALVLKNGELAICCRRLGDQFHDDPYMVPLKSGYLQGSADEACGFTKWSVAVRDDDELRVIQSLEAHQTQT